MRLFPFAQDADILVLPPSSKGLYDSEMVKNLLCRKDADHFYLEPSKTPGATYKVLHYRSLDSEDDTCKVDVVVPGTMQLPSLPPSQICWIDRFPVIPFSLLLLQKLQGWHDHRTAAEQHKRRKQYTDATDLQALLNLENTRQLRFLRPWTLGSLFTAEFQALSKDRVKAFCHEYPERSEDWRMLGFDL